MTVPCGREHMVCGSRPKCIQLDRPNCFGCPNLEKLKCELCLFNPCTLKELEAVKRGIKLNEWNCFVCNLWATATKTRVGCGHHCQQWDSMEVLEAAHYRLELEIRDEKELMG